MPNWEKILQEIQKHKIEKDSETQNAVHIVRGKYLLKLSKLTKRNVIAYYSGFLQRPDIENLSIEHEDKNGFMMAIHGLKCKKGLDLILHTPGGDIAATESIIDYLHRKFDDIRVIIPQLAMSAGTIIACSAKSILMGKHSSL